MALQVIDSTHSFGIQVRVGQGPGQTKFLAFRKHGGREATLRQAKCVEQQMMRARGRTSGRKGILQANNKSGLPGIRFEWRQYGDEWTYLYAVGNYTDVRRNHRAFAYSVEKHGFEGALTLALEQRKRGGAPCPPLEDAAKAIWPHYQAMLHE